MQNLKVRDGKRAVVAAACLVALWMVAPAAGAMQVGTQRVPDTDGDGVDDLLELVLGTDPLIADTDGDGISDGVELARRSDPLAGSNVPGPSFGQISVGLWSRASGVPGYVRAFSFIYLPAGYPATGLQMELVVLDTEDNLIVLGETYFASPVARRTIDFLPVAGDDTALLMVVGIDLSDQVIAQQGHMSAAVVIWHGAATAPEANERDKDAIDGFWLRHPAGGPILYRRPILEPGAAQGGSVVYQPIEPSFELPPNWTAGEICHQKTVPVGYESGIVITRVVDANCEEGWDSHCSPVECAASTGDEYRTLDPVGLIGG